MAVEIVPAGPIPETGPDLEDYAAALFQASGYYLEKSLIERDPDDVLELDIVASKYEAGHVRRILAEVKGGGWGYPDVFKVVGWLRYLGLSEGAFLARRSHDHLSQVCDRAGELGVTLVQVSDAMNASDVFRDVGLGSPHSPELVELWRRSCSAERLLASVLSRRFKGSKGLEGPRAARDYHRLINDGTFFSQSPEESLRLLYRAFTEHPKFTAANASEVDGNGYNPHEGGRSAALVAALRDGTHPYLQACMYLEHRARLAIVKAATDHILDNPDGGSHLIADLPYTLQNAVEWLRGQPTFWRYPAFWQQLMWGWGGFVIDERLDDEYAWMAALSGVPQGEVAGALETFDRFFPSQNEWFRKVGQSSVRQVLLMPTVFKGVGSHYRRLQYQEGDFTRIVKSRHAARDLECWLERSVASLSGGPE